MKIKSSNRSLFLLGCLWAFFVTGFTPAQPIRSPSRSSFRVVDIFVDAKGKSLAAYQLEWKVASHNAKIVGIEGGDHAAFKQPPQYDPRAIQGERVIVAAFNIANENALPRRRTRLATIHLEAPAGANCKFELEKFEAADAQGRRISVNAWSTERTVR